MFGCWVVQLGSTHGIKWSSQLHSQRTNSQVTWYQCNPFLRDLSDKYTCVHSLSISQPTYGCFKHDVSICKWSAAQLSVKKWITYYVTWGAPLSSNPHRQNEVSIVDLTQNTSAYMESQTLYCQKGVQYSSVTRHCPPMSWCDLIMYNLCS